MEKKMDKSVLEACGITTETILEKIVDQVTGNVGFPEEVRLYMEKAIDKKINLIFGKKVNAIIDSKIEQIMESAFSIKITPVDKWGSLDGKPFTIRERMFDQASIFWTEKVDDQGKVYTGYNQAKCKSRAEMMIESAVKNEITKAVEISAKEATVKFRAALKKSQSEWVSLQIDKMFK